MDSKKKCHRGVQILTAEGMMWDKSLTTQDKDLIFELIQKNNLDGIKRLVEEKPRVVQVKHRSGRYAFAYALQLRRQKICEYFLDSGAPFWFISDEEGGKLVAGCLDYGFYSCLIRLIDMKVADVNHTYKSQTVLTHLLGREAWDHWIIQEIVDRGGVRETDIAINNALNAVHTDEIVAVQGMVLKIFDKEQRNAHSFLNQSEVLGVLMCRPTIVVGIASASKLNIQMGCMIEYLTRTDSEFKPFRPMGLDIVHELIKCVDAMPELANLSRFSTLLNEREVSSDGGGGMVLPNGTLVKSRVDLRYLFEDDDDDDDDNSVWVIDESDDGVEKCEQVEREEEGEEEKDDDEMDASPPFFKPLMKRKGDALKTGGEGAKVMKREVVESVSVIEIDDDETNELDREREERKREQRRQRDRRRREEEKRRKEEEKRKEQLLRLKEEKRKKEEEKRRAEKREREEDERRRRARRKKNEEKKREVIAKLEEKKREEEKKKEEERKKEMEARKKEEAKKKEKKRDENAIKDVKKEDVKKDVMKEDVKKDVKKEDVKKNVKKDDVKKDI
ncbi:hypothetical protein ElyMa_002538900, partial [Elysia marginata]